MASVSAAVPEFLDRVARRRWLMRALLHVVLLAGAALLASAIAYAFYPDVAPLVAAAAAMLAIAVAVVGLLVDRWLAPSPARLAARLDRQLDLPETLSTVIGLGAGATDGPVARALVQHAGDVARGIAPRQSAPAFGRTMAIALGFLAVSTIGAGTAYLGSLSPSDRPLSAQPAQEETAVTVDQLEAVAQLIAEEAGRRNSDYLAAVSRSLEQLAKEYEAGRPADAVTADLQALLEHARAGYGSEVPDWLQGDTDNVAGMLAEAQATAEAQQQAREARASARPDPGTSLDMYELARQRAEANAQLAAGSAPEDAPAPDTDDGRSDAGPSGSDDFAASPMQSKQLQNAGSFPVGGAAQSGKGASNIAGGGTQPMLDDSGFLRSMPDPSQDMALTAADPQQDGRIRLFVPTTAEARDSTGTVGGAADFARLAAQAVDRQSVGGDALSVVSRYFNNMPDGEGDAP